MQSVSLSEFFRISIEVNKVKSFDYLIQLKKAHLELDISRDFWKVPPHVLLQEKSTRILVCCCHDWNKSCVSNEHRRVLSFGSTVTNYTVSHAFSTGLRSGFLAGHYLHYDVLLLLHRCDV
jgi:hypothetical protein